jgi:hypothetical protein
MTAVFPDPPVEHEPRGLLSDAKGTGNFIAADTVLGAGFKPDDHKPTLERQRAIFHDRPYLGAELTARVLGVALPAALIDKEGNLVRSAVRAADPVRPSDRNEESESGVRIGEIADGLDERRRSFALSVHAPMIANG